MFRVDTGSTADDSSFTKTTYRVEYCDGKTWSNIIQNKLKWVLFLIGEGQDLP